MLDNPPHSGTSSVLSLSGTSKFSGSVDTSGLNVALVAPDILISDRVVAESEADLRRMGVTHIVTIDTYPLTHGDRPAGESFVTHYIEAKDDLEEDLLLRLPELFEFMKGSKRTLFHCQMGVSRSAASCMAYLMHRDKRKLADVAAQICEARKQCGPNDAFMGQLMLFEKMEYRLDPQDISFQLYCLTHILQKKLSYRSSQTLTSSEKEEFYKFLPPPEANILCRRCRTRISSSVRIVQHRPGQNRSWHSEIDCDLNEAKSKKVNKPSAASHLDRCTKSIFVIPDEQILGQVYRVYDKIHCVKCHTSLGRYNWNGLSCECDGECSPGFLLRRSAVDLPPGV